MNPELKITEFSPISIEGGILIDGFPSVGFTEAIATESLIQTSQFELAGVIDSDAFPPISIIKQGKPTYPTRIFVNQSLKVAVFCSYLTIHQSLHRVIAQTMLSWARKHKIALIVSGVAAKLEKDSDKVFAAASTEEAKKKLKDAGFQILNQGTIPGIPSVLLNEGMLNNQNVAVISFNASGKGPDFKASAQLCLAMSKLIPGISCDISMLQKEAERVELELKETEQETKNLKDSMYR